MYHFDFEDQKDISTCILKTHMEKERILNTVFYIFTILYK